MPLVNFRTKFRFFSFDFCQNFKVWTFSQWLSIRGTNCFWRDIQKFFFKMFTWVLLDGFLNGFWKIWFFIVGILIGDFWVIFENYSMRMLSIRGNDFIAHWAYEETISSHTEHTPNEFLHMLSQRKNDNSFSMYSYAEHIGKWFYRTLSIRGNDFIAPWAYEEMILSHPEHTGKWFYRTLSIRGNVYKSNISAESNMIFKNLVLQALGTIKIRFLLKCILKNFMLVYL